MVIGPNWIQTRKHKHLICFQWKIAFYALSLQSTPLLPSRVYHAFDKNPANRVQEHHVTLYRIRWNKLKIKRSNRKRQMQIQEEEEEEKNEEKKKANKERCEHSISIIRSSANRTHEITIKIELSGELFGTQKGGTKGGIVYGSGEAEMNGAMDE